MIIYFDIINQYLWPIKFIFELFFLKIELERDIYFPNRLEQI